MISNKTRTAGRTLKSMVGRVVLATALGVLMSTAIAGEKAPKFTMTVISNESGSSKVLKGDYASAVERITSGKKTSRTGFASLTNLCVAYTKLGEIERAGEACEAAVQLVRKRRGERAHSGRLDDATATADRSDLAIALSNRGVLFAARGEWDRAFDDFEASHDLDVSLRAPSTNLARLDSAGH